MLSWWRRAIVSVRRKHPIFRAMPAGIAAVKKNQAWAPFPDCDYSVETDTPADRQVSANAVTSSLHVDLSKSAANQQVLSSSRGKTPIAWRP